MSYRVLLRSLALTALVLLGLSVVAAVATLALTYTPDALNQTYSGYLSEARSASFQRADDPPGWALEDGAADEAYWDAYLTYRGAKPVGLFRTKDDLKPLLLRPSSAPIPQLAATAPPSPECSALGLPDAPHTLNTRLTPALCARLSVRLSDPTVQEALAQLNHGCRRRDVRGPGHLDDPMAYDAHIQRPVLPFLNLAKLNHVQAHLDVAQGQHQRGLDRLLCNARFGLDLTHSYSLIHTLVGVLIQNLTLDGLRALFAYHPDLARRPELVAHAVDNLAWYRPTAHISARGFMGEYLYIMATGEVGPEDDTQLPKHLRKARAKFRDTERHGSAASVLLARNAVRHYHPYYTGPILLADTPPAESLAALTALKADLDASFNPNASSLALHIASYRAIVDLLVETHDRTTLTLADLHHQLTRGAHAPSLQTLKHTRATTCTLSGEPYTFEDTGTCRALVCGAIEPALLKALHNATEIGVDVYAVKTCLIPAPPALPSAAPKMPNPAPASPE